MSLSGPTTTSSPVSSRHGMDRASGKRDSGALRYLDLEAEVDRSDDEEELDEDSEDEFIDDITNENVSESHERLNSRLRQLDDAAIVRPPSPSSQRPALSAVASEPHLQPTPLWAVRCKPNKEFAVVTYAMHHAIATRTYIILSIHYRNNGDGILFLDTHNPVFAAKILSKCAFVLRVRGNQYSNVDMRHLDDIQDSIRTLRFTRSPISRGTWVRLSNPKFGRVKTKPLVPPKPSNTTPFDYIPANPPNPKSKSYYHEDLALVVENSPERPHEYTILVVPRAEETLSSSSSSLGDQIVLKDKVLENLKMGEMCLQAGLRLEVVNQRNVITFSNPPASREVAMFLSSGHDAVCEFFPRVEQWVFEEGETVSDISCHVVGRIHTIRDNGIEIQLCHKGFMGMEILENRFIGWAAMKQWAISSYVRHSGGKEGFVLGNEGANVLFWSAGENNEPIYSAHRNSLRAAPTTQGIDGLLVKRRENATMEALRLSGMSKDTILTAMSNINRVGGLDVLLLTPEQVDKALAVTKTFGNPWKFWRVLVWKGKQRGYYHIVDIIVSRETNSGLKLQARTEIVNATGPPLLVDYDSVVDADLLLPLHLLKPPPPGLELPPNYCHPVISGLQKQRSARHPAETDPDFPRAATPPPDPSSSTPADAWNPEHVIEISDSTPIATTPGFSASYWRMYHPSQIEFYECDSVIADLIFFQVKLSGIIPELKHRKYQYSEKGSWLSVHFRKYADYRLLTIEWQRLKGRIPGNTIIYPNRPTKKSNLPLVVLRGDFRNQVVTKIAGVGTDLYVLPVLAASGDVDTSVEPMKVSCDKCVLVRLRDAAHKKWSQFKIGDWQRAKDTAATQ